MLKETTENTESDTGGETRYSFGGNKAETANITQLFLVQKKWNSTAKKQKQYDQKQVGAEVLTENGDLRLTTLKWNLIKVELQSNPDVARKKGT